MDPFIEYVTFISTFHQQIIDKIGSRCAHIKMAGECDIKANVEFTADKKDTNIFIKVIFRYTKQ